MSENVTQTIQIIDTPYSLTNRDIICYPNYVCLLKVYIPRLFMKPRIVYATVTVDLVKGIAALSDMFPEYRAIEIDHSAIIPELVTAESAIQEARKLMIKWARHKFKVYKVPEIEIVQQQKLYKAFFYADINNEKMLIDTVKGVETET